MRCPLGSHLTVKTREGVDTERVRECHGQWPHQAGTGGPPGASGGLEHAYLGGTRLTPLARDLSLHLSLQTCRQPSMTLDIANESGSFSPFQQVLLAM